MSDDASQQEPTTTDDFEPITSQEQFEARLGKRLERERSKFSDYADLKAKAEKFDEVENAAKTELQRAQERAAELEANLAGLQVAKLRSDLAGESGVPAELVTGETEDEMRASIAKLIAFRGEDKPRPPKPNPHQGLGGGTHALNGDGLEAALRSKLGIG